MDFTYLKQFLDHMAAERTPGNAVAVYQGGQLVYEEMGVALREMNSGISEVEAYERFGKRCGVLEYIKFGALLTQNLRKGSRSLDSYVLIQPHQRTSYK